VSTGAGAIHPKRAALARQPGPPHHRHRLPRPRTNGQPITATGIRTPDDLSISQGGVVSVRGRASGSGRCLADRRHQGGRPLFTRRSGARPAGTTVEQGYLEGSGVEAGGRWST
jgi:hypothetical protein